jgi:hypothetical protein
MCAAPRPIREDDNSNSNNGGGCGGNGATNGGGGSNGATGFGLRVTSLQHFADLCRESNAQVLCYFTSVCAVSDCMRACVRACVRA